MKKTDLREHMINYLFVYVYTNLVTSNLSFVNIALLVSEIAKRPLSLSYRHSLSVCATHELRLLN